MKNITFENFEEEVLNSVKPCIVVFKHDGCYLCRGLTSVIHKLRRKYLEDFKFGFVNTFSEEYLTDYFAVDGVPTMFIFVDGDGREIEYPENPNPLSGYSEKYLIGYIEDNFFQNE